MKIRKLIAAILCTAMTLTSLGVDTMASVISTSETEDVLVTVPEESEDMFEIESEPEGDGLLEVTLDDTVTEEAEDVFMTVEEDDPDEDEGSVSSDSIASMLRIGSGTVSNDKYVASSCFSITSATLDWAEGYGGSGQKVSDYTQYPVIPKNVTTIPVGFFDDDQGIETVSFEDGSLLTTIDPGAFAGCSVKVFRAPNKYTYVQDETFRGCTSLVGFEFNNITTIGEYAFAGCSAFGSNINQLAGGSKITSIGAHAFAQTGFTKLDLSEFRASNITVGNYAFEGCRDMLSAVIPSGFTVIPEGCFKGCTNLGSITMGKNVTEIQADAFNGCSKLKTVNFNTTKDDTSKVASIGDRCFKGCTLLQTITFPKACVNFGSQVFQGCTSLTDVYFMCKGNDGTATTFVMNDDAFGGLSGVKVHGYDGRVRDYCSNKNNLEFVSLNAAFSVRLGNSLKSNGITCKLGGPGMSVGQDKSNVPVGSQVYFTVYIAGGHVMVDRVRDLEEDDVDIKFEQGNPRQAVFSFYMPAHDVTLDVTQIDGATFGALHLSYSIDRYNDSLLYEPYNDGYRTEKAGNRGVLNLSLVGTKDGVYMNYPLGLWNAQFSSSVPSVATIDSTGLVTAVKAGRTQITAQIKTTNIKAVFWLYVEKNVVLDKLEFDQVEFIQHPGKDPDDAVKANTPVYYDEEPGEPKLIYEIKYFSSELASVDRKFRIRLKATDEDGGDMFVNANWSSSNSGIASLASSTTQDNYNIVTVKKNSLGTVTIKASYNTGERYTEGVYKGRPIIRNAYAIVYIVDPTPTTASVIRVNKQQNIKEPGVPESQQNYGTLIPIVANSQYPIAANGISSDLYRKNKNGQYEIYHGVSLISTGIVKDGNPQYRLYVTDREEAVNSLALNREIKFNGNNKLYIRGRFANNSMGDFYIPINDLTIFNQLPNPRLSKRGIINVFYNYRCYDVDQYGYTSWDDIMGKDTDKTPENVDKYAELTVGQIYLGQSYAKESAEVDFDKSKIVDDFYYNKYQLDHREESLNPTPGTPDYLRANFALMEDPNSENNFVIRRNENALLLNENNQLVNMGWIFIYYKGYKDPYITRLKVDTKNVLPSYIMTQTLATKNVVSSEAYFKFQLLSRRTREPAFTHADVASFITNQQKSTPSHLFDDPDTTQLTDTGDGYIYLHMAGHGNMGRNTAVMDFKLDTWEGTASVTYNVNVNDAMPNPRLSSGAINLNSKMTGDEAKGEVKLILDQTDCEVDLEYAPVFMGIDRQRPDANKIAWYYGPDADNPGQCIIKAWVTDNTISRGSYRFKLKPVAEYPGGGRRYPREVYVNVNIQDGDPVLNLSNINCTFNLTNGYAGKETHKLIVRSVGFMPVGIIGAEVRKDGDPGMVITANNPVYTFKGNTRDADLVADAATVANNLDLTVHKVKDEKTGKYHYELWVKLGDVGLLRKTSINIPYDVSGIKVNGAEIRPFRLNITSRRNTPGVQVRVSSNINSVDPFTKYTVNVYVMNLVNPDVSDLQVLYYDSTANAYRVDDQFIVEKDTKDLTGMTWYLKANHSASLEDNPRTRFRMGRHDIYLSFKVADNWFRTNTNMPKLSLTPTQILPGLKQEINKAVFFSHQDPNDRQVTYKLTKTSQLKSHVKEIRISDSNPSELKNAFSVAYTDRDTDEDARRDMKNTVRTWYAGDITLRCRNDRQLVTNRVYNLKLEVIMDGQFYKRNNRGDLVYDDNGRPILTPGQTINIQVVVQN